MKTCSKCKVSKEPDKFSKRSKSLDGLNFRCRECTKKWHAAHYRANSERMRADHKQWKAENHEQVKAYNKRYRTENPERGKAARKRWTAENIERTKAYRLNRKYGITPENFEQMQAAQGGVCAICKHVPEGPGFNIDHCHKTGKVRGLLCGNCNRALGLLKDSAINTQSATEYLLRFK